MIKYRGNGFTLIEIIVVASIILTALAAGLVQYRNSRPQALNMASNLAFHMDVRKATDKLTETLLNGTEIIKPLEGSSLQFMVLKDLVNNIQVLYLEKAKNKADEPFILVSYTDNFSGRPDDSRKKVLFKNVKDINFTTVSPGLVVVNFTLLSSAGKELAAVVEIPLVNFGSIDG